MDVEALLALIVRGWREAGFRLETCPVSFAICLSGPGPGTGMGTETGLDPGTTFLLPLVFCSVTGGGTGAFWTGMLFGDGLVFFAGAAR